MLDLGNHIEFILKKNNKNKKWLCDTLKELFYTNETAIGYKTFVAKLSNNTLSAIEFLQIAYILNLKLDKIKDLLEKDLNEKDIKNESEEKNMEEIIEKLILSSEFYGYNNNFEILENDDQEYYLICHDTRNDFGAIEFFDLSNNKTKVLGIVKNLEKHLIESGKSIKKFQEMKSESKYEFIKNIIDEQNSFFPNNKPIEEDFRFGIKRNYMEFPKYKEECYKKLKEISCEIDKDKKKCLFEDLLQDEFMKSTDIDILMQYHIFLNTLEVIGDKDFFDIVKELRKEFIKSTVLNYTGEEINYVIENYKTYNVDQEEVISTFEELLKNQNTK